MTRPRSEIVSLDSTPYYHCISRCVRRAFLFGKDAATGKSFNHRKPWLVERLRFLAEIFAIDIAAYAIMSNHFHVVVHIDKDRADRWSDEEVIQRWTRMFKGPPIVRKYVADKPLTPGEESLLKNKTVELRLKLYSLSKFMACLNEYIARRANKEDDVTGRFWEGRFKSQALLDEAAILSCMAYVDLNPIRAGIAGDLPSSDFTSIQERIKQVQTPRDDEPARKQPKTPRLMRFSDESRAVEEFKSLPFSLNNYLALADRTGRVARRDKMGSIDPSAAGILTFLNISEEQWRLLALDIQKRSITMLNGLNTLTKMARKGTKAV